MKVNHMPGFVRKPHGFEMRFQNGYMISVVFGPGCYCSNYDMNPLPYGDPPCLYSPDAEIAVYDPDGKNCTEDISQILNIYEIKDEIGCYMSPEAVASIINYLSLLHNQNDPPTNPSTYERKY